MCRVDRVDRRVGAEVGAGPRAAALRLGLSRAPVLLRLEPPSRRPIVEARLFMPSSLMMARLRATRSSLSRS